MTKVSTGLLRLKMRLRGVVNLFTNWVNRKDRREYEVLAWWRRFWDRLTMAGFDVHTVRGQSPPERVR